MVSAPKHQFSWTRGQLDYSVALRPDMDAYYKGGLELTNFELMSHGDLKRRGGLEYVAEIPAAASGVRMGAFEFSNVQKYLIVFVDSTIKIFKDGAHQADEVTTFSASDLPGLDWTQSLDTMLIDHQSKAPQQLVRQGSHTSWSLSPSVLTNIPTYRFADPTTSNGTPAAITGNTTFTSVGDEFVSGDVGNFIIGNQGRAEITTFTNTKSVSITVTQDFKNTTVIEGGDWTIEEPAWSVPRGYPGSVALFQGRTYHAGAQELLQTVWGSRSGNQPFDYKETHEALEDEAVAATLDGEAVNAVQRVVGLGDLFLFTTGGVFAVIVPETGIAPDRFRPSKQTAVPAAKIRPVEIEDTLAYIAADDDDKATTLHQLLVDPESNQTKYFAQDLNLLATSVLNVPVDLAARKGRQDSTSATHAFVVNSDGTVAVMHTRRRESVLGWTVWKTPGNSGADQLKASAVVGTDVYFVVKRTINSVDRYFLEKVNAAAFFDSSVTRSIASITITGATQSDPVVVTAVAHGLTDGDVINLHNLTGMTELNGRSFTVANATTDTVELSGEDGTGHTAYTSGGTISATSTFGGFSHLTGETLAVWADGAKRDDVLVNGSGQIVVTDGGDPLVVSTLEAGMPLSWVAETMPLEAQLSDGTLIGETHRLSEVTVRVINAYDLTINGRGQSFRRMRGMTLDTSLQAYTGPVISKLLGWNRRGDDPATIRLTGDLPITLGAVKAVITQ